jgi:hypothetical protein
MIPRPGSRHPCEPEPGRDDRATAADAPPRYQPTPDPSRSHRPAPRSGDLRIHHWRRARSGSPRSPSSATSHRDSGSPRCGDERCGLQHGGRRQRRTTGTRTCAGQSLRRALDFPSSAQVHAHAHREPDHQGLRSRELGELHRGRESDLLRLPSPRGVSRVCPSDKTWVQHLGRQR